MKKEHLFKISLICLICAIVSCTISYFFFHFVTDEGITLTWHPEAGKPFVSDMLGTLTTLFFFAAAFCLIIALVVFKEEKETIEKNASSTEDERKD